jgi:hypothetical protein
VAAYSLAYAIAFVGLYFQEHPYKVSSYWIFEHVPAGSRLVGPHWDDKVPVSVAGKNSSIYVMEGRDTELPVYERDVPAMLEGIVRKVSAADYIMFPTPRTPDSIPRIPDEYPNTTALLRLLWGEKIGFTLEKTFKNRPSFLGVTFNDDLADESFSVYDHPKVAVFRNVERLPADEILRRVKNVAEYEPLPSMNEMLLMDTGGWKPGRRFWNPAWNGFVSAVAVLLGISLASWLVVGRIFRMLPDGGLGLSIALGLVVPVLFSWGLSAAGIVPMTRHGVWFVVLGLICVAFSRFALQPSARTSAAKHLGEHGIYVLVTVICGSIVAYIMHSSDPGFFGLGAQVDSAYLTYFARNQDPFPQDVFHPGKVIPLNQLDKFIFGWVLKLLGTAPGTVTATVSILIGAALGGVLYSVCALVVKGRRVSVVASIVALIPCAYLVHAVRDSANQHVLASSDIELFRNESAYSGLTKWAGASLVGSPCLVVACDDDSLRFLPAAVGLPVCVTAQAVSDGAISACKLDEPEAAFHRMMEMGAELFVTPAQELAQSEEQRRRAEQFAQREDLFYKLFDDGKFVVFAPAFSRYFLRHKDPVSS